MAAWETGSQEKPEYAEKREAPDAPSKDPSINPDLAKKKKSVKIKSDFTMTGEMAAKVNYAEHLTLSEFVARLNESRDEDEMKRLTIKSMEQRLVENGYLEEYFINRIPLKRLTEQGAAFGIETEKRTSTKGNEYDVFFYSVKAQQEMVRWLLEAN